MINPNQQMLIDFERTNAPSLSVDDIFEAATDDLLRIVKEDRRDLLLKN
jgi:hypothetical protein